MSENIYLTLKTVKESFKTDPTANLYIRNLKEISFFVKLVMKHNANTKRLIRKLKPLLLEIRPDNQNLSQVVSQIEDQLISVLSSDCQTIPTNIPRLLAETRSMCQSPILSSTLPYFLQLLYVCEFGQDTVPFAYQIFSTWIFKFLSKIGISSTRFSHCLFKKFICGMPHQSFEECMINVPSISRFFNYFLIKRNLKFFSKVSQISAQTLKSTKISKGGLNVTVSKSKPEFMSDIQALPVMTKLKFTNGCLNLLNDESFRDDYMILIGKHPLCDIKLPETDPEAEDVTCVIFPSYKYWKILDVTESSPPRVSVKLAPNESYSIEPGCLISFGKTCTLEVVDILYKENEFGVLVTTLRFRFIRGPYVYQLKEFRANLSQNLETYEFLVGRGSLGKTLSLFIDERYGLGRLHASFNYTKQGWVVVDLGSVRGSFLHLKKGTDGQRFSAVSNLLNKNQESSTLNICDYIFYISRDLEN